MNDRGPLPWREATFIVEVLSHALADCHAAGIVHRDVKPGNVLLTDHLQPRLADFGINLPAGTVTGGSAVAYTPSYSPPEAFGSGTAEPTTDVYSLGATLWALLAGRAPFTEHGAGAAVDVDEIIERSTTEPPGPPAGDTPPPITRLVERAMHKDPGRRHPDAGQFAADLRRAIRLAEQGRGPDPSTPGRDRLLTAAFGGLVVAGVLLLTASLIWLLFG